jgi:nitrile hydratase
LVEKGHVTLADLEARAAGRFPLARPARPNRDDGCTASATPRFEKGQRVRVRRLHRPGHTRAPGYVHGRTGCVVHVAPPFPYPDANAHGLPGRREPTYHVAFTAEELWGEEAEERSPVVVDLWETYLEAVE